MLLIKVNKIEWLTGISHQVSHMLSLTAKNIIN